MKYLLGFGSVSECSVIGFNAAGIVQNMVLVLFLLGHQNSATEVSVLILESGNPVGSSVLSKKRRWFDFISHTWWNLLI